MRRPALDSELSLSRRRTLRALGAGIGTGLVGSLLLPGAIESPDVTETPTFDTDRDVEELDESETPYAIRHYRADGEDGFTPTLPINAVAPLERATFDDLVQVFEDAGWVPYPAEYTRYAWDVDSEKFVPTDWSGAETYYGKAGRLHVRCWELAGTGSIQAHTDTQATPTHGIRSYAEGRAAVEALFDASGWEIAGYVDLQNERGDHDGRAVEVVYDTDG